MVCCNKDGKIKNKGNFECLSVCVCVCVCVCARARANFKIYSEKALTPEAVAQRSSVKKVFLEIWQNSQKTSVLESLFLLKKRLWHCAGKHLYQSLFIY